MTKSTCTYKTTQILWQSRDDWAKMDFNHYHEPISTAFKTMLKSDLRFLFAEPLPPNDFFVNLHRYYQLYHPGRFPKLHLKENKKGNLPGWQVKQDKERWCNIFPNYTWKRTRNENFMVGRSSKTKNSGALFLLHSTAITLTSQMYTHKEKPDPILPTLPSQGCNVGWFIQPTQPDCDDDYESKSKSLDFRGEW